MLLLRPLLLLLLDWIFIMVVLLFVATAINGTPQVVAAPFVEDWAEESDERVEDETGVGGREMCEMSRPGWRASDDLGVMCSGFQVMMRLSLIEPV